jgi:hypothetical protein
VNCERVKSVEVCEYMWTVDLVEESEVLGSVSIRLGGGASICHRAPRRHRLVALANGSDDGESGCNMAAIFAVGSSPFA